MENFKSIEHSDVMFPDISYYDISKAGDMALYLAHCDFYPFKSVIENNKNAINSVYQTYASIADDARDHNDFKTECWAMNSMSLQSCRVNKLTYYSLLLVMVSLLEESVNTLCRLHKNMLSLNKDLEDYKDSGLDRTAEYLKKEVQIKGFKADRQWEYITAIRECRNMIVHNGGRVKEKLRPICDKFNIGYREEDYQLYIEYEDIMTFYNAILDFMDRAFRIEPDAVVE